MSKKKVKATVPEAAKESGIIQCHDEEGRKAHPRLASCFYPMYQGDDLTWLGGSIRVSNRGGMVYATLDCPQEDKQVTAVTDSILTVLDALEAVLSVAPVPWEKTYGYKKTRIAQLKGDE